MILISKCQQKYEGQIQKFDHVNAFEISIRTPE